MDFNDVFLPKIEGYDQQCGAEKVNLVKDVRILNVENRVGDDVDLVSIDQQVDGLLSKLEADLSEVEKFYSSSTRKQLNGSKDTQIMMRLGASPVPSIKKKNQIRAVAATRRQEFNLLQDKGSQDQKGDADLEDHLALENGKMTKNISSELRDADIYLEQLRETVIRKGRKFSVEEKRKLGAAFAKLTPEHVVKALEIVAQSNPNITGAAEVDIDMDALSLCTLWRLKLFVYNALKLQASIPVPPPPPTLKAENDDCKAVNNKRKKKFCDAAGNTRRTETEPVGN